MKRITIAAALLLLGGCSSSGSDYVQYFRAVRQSFSASSGDITKAEAAAVPYASIAYRLGNDGPQHILVLATDTNGELLWTSSSHIVLVTREGRIVRSVGLAHDLTGVTPSGGAAVPSPAAAIARPFTSARLEDFPDLSAYGVRVNCSTRARGPETITILGRGITSIHVDEDCDATGMNWSFTDSYWVDPKSAFVWRSIQHIHPKEDGIETEILRPPT